MSIASPVSQDWGSWVYVGGRLVEHKVVFRLRSARLTTQIGDLFKELTLWFYSSSDELLPNTLRDLPFGGITFQN